ncbi:carboxymuconolactone decarboxylase family protein (plasmid) [Photobacterium sp. DA100]|uniref:carboxymuconolactone decarboxylase family protein n=1 Tax=Photobacterium sp. DA100 TaxID=3027472 RepID=UPI00247A6522|nr:carboxymuconolactone decarboxylase family protein [Photobacterium sp. DA100]WEM44195.1 carboxymuconolactone decarboxylase family protein [Photobacterium sp. DA100]
MSRVNIYVAQPEAYKAMFGLESYIKECNLSPVLEELIRVRTSQINGCAYCIQMHTTAALEQGETQERLFSLPAWKESPLFTSEERAVLALTEEITHISKYGVSDTTYKQLAKYFEEVQIAQLIMLVSVMNTWNRIAVATKVQ